MPAGIKEAYRSPFSKSNPASQFYDLNSFTKSSHTDSIRNEYFQSQLEFNNQYQLGSLPNYNPTNTNSQMASSEHPLTALNSQRYPTLQPFGQPSYSNSNDTESLRQDPHQGAGWPNSNLPPYIKQLPPANVNQFGSTPIVQPQAPINLPPPRSYPIDATSNVPPNFEGFSNPPQSRYSDRHSDAEDDLIDRVLTNKKYRRLLRRLLIENDDDELDDWSPPRHRPSKQRKAVEGFATQDRDDSTETLRMIAIYGLGGILILCLLDLLVKLGQVLGRRG
jgi:hypothetical protein